MEKDVGIEVYFTSTKGLGGRIKVEPEDFIVEEMSLLLSREDGGKYMVARIRARNWETNRLVRVMARSLRISRKRIRFAGTKDKKALTTQFFQFDLESDQVQSMRIKDVEVLDVFQSNKEIDIGDLRGNIFDIMIKKVDFSSNDALKIANATVEELKRKGGFPNFFGMQRFGSIRPVTHIIGRHMIKGEFHEAVDAYVAKPFQGEGDVSFELRTQLEETGDYAEALKTYPDVMSFEKAILNHLVSNPGDYIGGLQQLPFNLLMMFVHGFQSYLFNRILSERIRRGIPIGSPIEGDIIVPIDPHGLPDDKRLIPVDSNNLKKVAKQMKENKASVTGILFGSNPFFAKGVMGEIERSVVDSEKLKPEDFTLPKMPRLSSKGMRRALVVALPELEVSSKNGAIRMRFELPRGCYATVLLREFMKVDPLEA